MNQLRHFYLTQLSAPVDFRINFGSYVVDSILTQEGKLHNFEGEECGSKVEPSNSINFGNETWLSPQILPKKNCNGKKEEVSDTHFLNIQISVPVVQQNVTPVGLFEQFFDGDVIAFIVNMPICAQIETREKENSKLTLLKYVWLSQSCFLLDKTITSSDVDNVAMPNAMSNNHFEETLSVLYLSDNINLDEQFIMTKIRPFYDMIGKCCIEN